MGVASASGASPDVERAKTVQASRRNTRRGWSGIFGSLVCTMSSVPPTRHGVPVVVAEESARHGARRPPRRCAHRCRPTRGRSPRGGRRAGRPRAPVPRGTPIVSTVVVAVEHDVGEPVAHREHLRGDEVDACRRSRRRRGRPVVVDLLRRADLARSTPSSMTTMRSLIDSASSWSWVTNTVVMPTSAGGRAATPGPARAAWRRGSRTARRAAAGGAGGPAPAPAPPAAAGRRRAGAGSGRRGRPARPARAPRATRAAVARPLTRRSPSG